MPKKKKGGNRQRRDKKNAQNHMRDMIFREEGQAYAQVVRMLGHGRLEAFCFDGVTRLAHIRGNMRKKIWIRTGDIILVSLREYQDAKADVIHRYNDEESRVLKNTNELPSSIRLDSVVDTLESREDEHIGFEFDDI